MARKRTPWVNTPVISPDFCEYVLVDYGKVGFMLLCPAPSRYTRSPHKSINNFKGKQGILHIHIQVSSHHIELQYNNPIPPDEPPAWPGVRYPGDEHHVVQSLTVQISISLHISLSDLPSKKSDFFTMP